MKAIWKNNAVRVEIHALEYILITRGDSQAAR